MPVDRSAADTSEAVPVKSVMLDALMVPEVRPSSALRLAAETSSVSSIVSASLPRPEMPLTPVARSAVVTASIDPERVVIEDASIAPLV